MTQPHLLELAKQGQPVAIAELMNLTLKPRGVTASTELYGNCLYIVFRSERLLNQETLVAFTRRGITDLGIRSVSLVKMYGHKIGETTPTWSAEFALEANVSQDLEPEITSTPREPSPEPGDRPGTDFLTLLYRIFPAWMLGGQQRPIAYSAAEPSWQAEADRPMGPFPPLAVAIGVGIAAFVAGGVIAILANTNTSASSTGSSQPSTGRPLSEASIQTVKELATEQYQAETLKYLDKMTRAQQSFYQTHRRFAANLEELERAASIISQSNHYHYKLSNVQGLSQLTATPKSSELKSYTAVTLVKPGTTQSHFLVCESNQATTTPPTIAPGNLQCPTGSTKVLQS